MADFIWDKEPVLCFTADVDWASEESLEECHRLFESFGVKVTYFMTHPSKVLQSLHDKSAVNVGIHPNFLKGSSHGEDFESVIEYCTTQLPKTECFRSHRYYDVTDTDDDGMDFWANNDGGGMLRFRRIDPFIDSTSIPWSYHNWFKSFELDCS